MTRIKVTPEQLHSASNALNGAMRDLTAIVGRMDRAWRSLEMDIRERASIERDIAGARHMASVASGNGETLASYLARKAQEFEQADQQGAAAMASVPKAPILSRPIAPRIAMWPLPALSIVGLDFLRRIFRAPDARNQSPKDSAQASARGGRPTKIGRAEIVSRIISDASSDKEDLRNIPVAHGGLGGRGYPPTGKDNGEHPDERIECVRWARVRRAELRKQQSLQPIDDLPALGGEGGAKDLIGHYGQSQREISAIENPSNEIKTGAIIVYDGTFPGSKGNGHVQVVEEVQADGVWISEANGAGRALGDPHAPGDIHNSPVVFWTWEQLKTYGAHVIPIDAAVNSKIQT